MQLDQQQRHSALGQLTTCKHQTGHWYLSLRLSKNEISVSFSVGLSSAVLLQNSHLKSTFPATKLRANSEAVKASPPTRKIHKRHDAQAKELPQFLPTQPVRLQEPKIKKWSKPGEVLSRAEASHSHVIETPKGVRRNRNTRYTSKCKSSTRVQAPARTTEVLRIAVKPPSLQPTAQCTDVTRTATMSPSHQHKTPAVLNNQSARSTNEAFINVQSDMLQPQSVIKVNDKPHVLAIIIKLFPMSQSPSPMTFCKRIQKT